jgi:long-chain acyl-CoA synthetase
MMSEKDFEPRRSHFSKVSNHQGIYRLKPPGGCVKKSQKQGGPPMINLAQMFRQTCSRYAGNTALIYEEQTIDYRTLERSVNALAHHLQTFGIRNNDKVALMLPNCPEFVVAYFACQLIGAVAVTLNVLSTPYELNHLLSDSDARVFITQPPLVRRFEEIKSNLPLCQHLLTTDDLKRITESGPFTVDIPEIAPEDTAVMIYTSGLTGKPLGAMLTHHNLLTQSDLIRAVCMGTEHYRSLAVIPLFHSFGAVVNMLAPIRVGASIVLMERFTLDSIFRTIEKEKVTYIAAVPRLFMGMVFHDKADQYDVSSVQFCITGGSAMPPEFIPLFKEKFGILLVEGYGLTEASPVCSVCPLERPVKPGSIGTTIPMAEARVMDENGRELPLGQIGELVIRGENVMKGYYKNPEMTARVIRNGWLHTGDLARIDEDGYIFLTGRIKRMVITSGFNVYPVEVEQVLDMHPDIRTSRIVSKPDLIRGEIVKALIVPKPGITPDEKSIMRHCRTYLSSYKIPREIEFVDKIEEE